MKRNRSIQFERLEPRHNAEHLAASKLYACIPSGVEVRSSFGGAAGPGPVARSGRVGVERQFDKRAAGEPGGCDVHGHEPRGGCCPGNARRRIRLASGTTITTSDPLLAEVTVGPLGTGQSQTLTQTVTIPSGTAPRSYYMGATANVTGSVQESNGSNNQRTTPITVLAQVQLPDLVVSALSVKFDKRAAGEPGGCDVHGHEPRGGCCPGNARASRLAWGRRSPPAIRCWRR